MHAYKLNNLNIFSVNILKEKWLCLFSESSFCIFALEIEKKNRKHLLIYKYIYSHIGKRHNDIVPKTLHRSRSYVGIYKL